MSKEHGSLVTVLTTGNKAIIAMAKSILDAAGIQYIVKGDDVQDLFVLGRFGSGFNPFTGPVKIQVKQNDEEEAKQLLKDLKESRE